MNRACESIIDSGASHHMTGVLHTLMDIHPISLCMVGLPNGKTVLANKEGSLVLTEILTLKRVFLVEELKCNLISVSQMINEMGCMALFDKTR